LRPLKNVATRPGFLASAAAAKSGRACGLSLFGSAFSGCGRGLEAPGWPLARGGAARLACCLCARAGSMMVTRSAS
jgi:hypothetical protein